MKFTRHTAQSRAVGQPHGRLTSRHGQQIFPHGSYRPPHGWDSRPHGRFHLPHGHPLRPYGRRAPPHGQQTGPDLTTIQPVINAIISGNHVNVKWGWGGNSAYLDICELQVDRNDGKGFVLLAFDTTPGYTDTQAFPATPAIWTYRAIYRVGDNQTGQWSLPVSVTVPA